MGVSESLNYQPVFIWGPSSIKCGVRSRDIVLLQDSKVYRGVKVYLHSPFNFRSIWRMVAGLTPRPLSRRRKGPMHPMNCSHCGSQSSSWRFGTQQIFKVKSKNIRTQPLTKILWELAGSWLPSLPTDNYNFHQNFAISWTAITQLSTSKASIPAEDNKDRHCTYNVTLSHGRVTTVVMEKQ